MAKYSNEVVYDIKTTLDSSGITKLRNELNNLKATMSSSSFAKTSGLTSAEIQRSIKEVNQLQAAITKAFNPKINTLDLSKLDASLRKEDISLQGITTRWAQMGVQGQKSISALANSLLSVNKNAVTVNSTLSKMATTMGNTVRWGITASIFQGMMSSISGAVSYMKDLDESLTQIQMVTGDSAENMRSLAQYANEAAQSLATTTTDYTNAVKIFAQEGFTTEESKLQANLSVKLANVSEQDTATTSDQITAYRNAFGLSIDEMSSSLDKLANVANNTAANVEELMTAAQRSASVASAVGASEDSFLASIATIQSVTRQSSEEIGNGLKTIYQRFADIKMGESTDDGVEYGEYAQALEKVGVEVVDASGQFKGMDQILSELQEVWGTLDDTTKIAVGEKVAGKFQYNRFAALMNNQDYYEKAYAATQNADGKMDEMQDTYADSIAGRLETLQAAGEQVMTTLFNQDDIEPILGDITTIVNGLNDIVDSANGLSGVLKILSGLFLKTFSVQIGKTINGIANSISSLFTYTKSMQSQSSLFEMLGFNKLQANKQNTMVGSFATEASKNYANVSDETQKIAQEHAQALLELEQKRADLAFNVNEAEQSIVMTLKQQIALNEQTITQNRQKIGKTNGERLQSSIGGLTSSVSKKQTAVDTRQETINKLTRERSKLTDEIASSEGETLKELTKQYQELTKKIKIQETELKREKESLADAKEKLQIYQDTIALEDKNKAINDEILIELQKVTDEIKKSGKLTEEGSTAWNKIKEQIQNCGISTRELNELLREVGMTWDQIEAAEQRSEEILSTMSAEAFLSSITKGIGNLVSVAFAIEMFQDVFKTWSDDSTTLEEKISDSLLPGLMAISMILPIITDAVKALKDAKKAEGAITGASTIANWLYVTSLKAAGDAATKTEVATEALSVAVKNLWKSFGPIVIAAVAVGAALGFAADTISKSIDQYSQYSNAVSDAKDNLADASTYLSDTQEDLANLTSMLDTLDSDQDAFDGLTKGSQEWDDAISQANQDAQEFLNTYGDILAAQGMSANEIMTKGTNGSYQITDKAKETAEKYENDKVAKAQEGYSVATASKQQAEEENSSVNFLREHNYETFEEDNLAEEISLGVLGALDGAAIGTAIGSAIAPGLGTIVGGVAGGLIGGAVMVGATVNAQTEERQQYENANSDQVSSVAQYLSKNATTASMSDDEFVSTLRANVTGLENLSDSMILQFKSDATDLIELGNTIIQGQQTVLNAAKQAAADMMSTDETYKNLNSSSQEVVDTAVAKETVAGGKYYDEAKAKVDEYSDEELKAKFAELNDAIEYVDGKFYEIGDDGKRTEVEDGYDTDYMKNQVMSSQMTESAKKYGQELADQISKANLNDDQTAALKAFAEDQSLFKGYENASMEEFISALKDGAVAVEGFADATDKISETSSFNELSAAKSAADIQDGNNATEQAETTKAYDAQLKSITESEAEKYDLDYDEIVAQANALAEAINNDGDAYNISATEARELAIQNQRMNNGIEDLSDNWDDWSNILKNSNKYDADYIKTTKKLNKTIADLVGASEDLNLSDEFYDSAENMALLEEAANGSEDAIEQLGFAVGKDLVQNLSKSSDMVSIVDNALKELNESGDDLDPSSSIGKINTALQNFDINKQAVLDGLDQISNAGLSVGQSVADAFSDPTAYNNWVNSLNEMALATGMSVDEMNSLLSSVNMTADVTVTEQEVSTKVPIYTEHSTVENVQTETIGEGDDAQEVTTYTKKHWTTIDGYQPATETIQVAQLGTNGDPGTANIKFVGNGSVGSSNKSSSSGGSSGGSGGGSGSSKSKRTTEADKNERDPLIEVENAIDRQTGVLEEQEELNDELYGSDKIANLNKVIASHEKLADLYEQELTLQEQQIALQQNQSTDEYGNLTVKGLAEKVGMTVEYNEDGDITNGKQIQEALYNAYKQAYDEETEHSDEDDYSSYTEETEKWKDWWDQWKEAESSYGGMIDNMEDIKATIRDETDAIQDTNDAIVDGLHENLDNWSKLISDVREFNKTVADFENGASIDKFSDSTVDKDIGIVNDTLNWTGIVTTADGSTKEISLSEDEYDKYNGDISNVNSQIEYNTKEALKEYYDDDDPNHTTKLEAMKGYSGEADGTYDWSKAESVFDKGNLTTLRDYIAEGNTEGAQSLYNDMYDSIMQNDSRTDEEKATDIKSLNEYVQGVEESCKKSNKQNEELIKNTDLTYTSLSGTSMWSASMKQLGDRFEDAKDAFEKNGDGDFSESDAYTNLNEALETARSLLTDMVEAVEDLRGSIGDAVDKMGELIDRQIKQYDDVLSQLSTLSSISDLVYGDSNTGAATQISIAETAVEALKGKIETDKATIDAYNETLATYTELATQNGMTLEELMQSDVISDEEVEAIEAAQDSIVDAQQDIYDSTEKIYEYLQTVLAKQAEAAGNQFTKDVLGTSDVDWLQQEWEMQTTNEELYLDDMNRAYGIQKLQYSYQQLLNESSNQNSLIQKKISEQMSDQLEYLQDKTDLSQTDLDYANAQLTVLEKEIALQDAQTNKNQMQLQRNASGNYEYVYVANEDDVAQKQQDLLDAQINAYNIAKQGLLEAEENTIEQVKSARDLIVSIWEDTTLNEQQKLARIQEVEDYIGTYVEASSTQIKTYSLETLQQVASSENQISEENKGNLTNIYDAMSTSLQSALNEADSRFETFSTTTGVYISNINGLFGTVPTTMAGVQQAVSKSSIKTLDNFDSAADTLMGKAKESLDTYEQNVLTVAQQAELDITQTGGETADTVDQDFKDLSSSASGLGDNIDTCKGKIEKLNTTSLSTLIGNLSTLNGKVNTIAKSLYGNNLDGKGGLVKRVQQATAEFDTMQQNVVQWLKDINKEALNVSNSIKDVGDKVSDVNTKAAAKSSAKSSESSSSSSSEASWHYNYVGTMWKGGCLWDLASNELGDPYRYTELYRYGHDTPAYDEGYVYEDEKFYTRSWYDTGGYTGTWNNGISDAKNGKLAVLHQKELVLNASDTENLLDIIKQVRQMQNVDLSQMFDVSGLISSSSDTIEQRVEITAEFPSVTSSQEIEQALLNLADSAYQAAYRNY